MERRALEKILRGAMRMLEKYNPGRGKEVMFIMKEVEMRPYVEIFRGRVQTRSFDWALIRLVYEVSFLFHPYLGGLVGHKADWRNLDVKWISWALPDIASISDRTQIKISFHASSCILGLEHKTKDANMVKMLQLYKYNKDGKRYFAGMVDVNAIESLDVNNVLLGPIDPEGDGKARLQVEDSEKESMMIIKIYKKGTPTMKLNTKTQEMEIVPYYSLWYKWDDGEKELAIIKKAIE